jgi:hypothetical protein
MLLQVWELLMVMNYRFLALQKMEAFGIRLDTRHLNDTWDHFIDVKGQAGNPGAFTSVASAYVLVTTPVRVVTLVQDVGPRFLDAHEIPQRDFNVVTRSPQNNDTQRWVLTQVQGTLYRIKQVSSGRFLDVHEIESRLPRGHPPATGLAYVT